MSKQELNQIINATYRQLVEDFKNEFSIMLTLRNFTINEELYNMTDDEVDFCNSRLQTRGRGFLGNKKSLVYRLSWGYAQQSHTMQREESNG